MFRFFVQSEQPKKKYTWLYPACCIAIGFVLLLFPGFVVHTLAAVLGVFCLVLGAIRLISALTGRALYPGSAILTAIVLSLFGFYVLIRPEQFFSLLPIVCGILFLSDGFSRICTALSIRRSALKIVTSFQTFKVGGRWKSTLIWGILTLAAGILLLFRPFTAVELTVRIIGMVLLFDGAGALWTAYAWNQAEEAMRNQPPADGKYDASFRDITDEADK